MSTSLWRPDNDVQKKAKAAILSPPPAVDSLEARISVAHSGHHGPFLVPAPPGLGLRGPVGGHADG